MSLFLGEMHHHIPGRKGLTEKKDIISLMPGKKKSISLWPLVPIQTLKSCQ